MVRSLFWNVALLLLAVQGEDLHGDAEDETEQTFEGEEFGWKPHYLRRVTGMNVRGRATGQAASDSKEESSRGLEWTQAGAEWAESVPDAFNGDLPTKGDVLSEKQLAAMQRMGAGQEEAAIAGFLTIRKLENALVLRSQDAAADMSEGRSNLSAVKGELSDDDIFSLDHVWTPEGVVVFSMFAPRDISTPDVNTPVTKEQMALISKMTTMRAALHAGYLWHKPYSETVDELKPFFEEQCGLGFRMSNSELNSLIHQFVKRGVRQVADLLVVPIKQWPLSDLKILATIWVKVVEYSKKGWLEYSSVKERASVSEMGLSDTIATATIRSATKVFHKMYSRDIAAQVKNAVTTATMAWVNSNKFAIRDALLQRMDDAQKAGVDLMEDKLPGEI